MKKLYRRPDRIIGTGYMSRWYLIPRNRILNIYLHRFTGSDDDRALHDHPWCSISVLLKGELAEHTSSGRRLLKRWLPKFRTARFSHRIELIRGPAWTIFITGPKVRSWGFHCPNGWRHWRDFTDSTGNQVGRGCE